MRADDSFDLYSFVAPVMFGTLLFIALVMSKFIDAPELAGTFSGTLVLQISVHSICWRILWGHECEVLWDLMELRRSLMGKSLPPSITLHFWQLESHVK